MADGNQIFDLLTSGGTALAAVAAAYSAWISRESARAARDTVAEAREARRLELAPRLVLERKFESVSVAWPKALDQKHTASVSTTASDGSTSDAPPRFLLQNFGQSPGIDIVIAWTIDDPNPDFDLPESAIAQGVSIGPGIPGSLDVHHLHMSDPSTSTVTHWPLYRRYTVDIPVCAPGQPCSVDLPLSFQNFLFARGLCNGPYARPGARDIFVSATVHSHSIDGTAHKQRFRWKIYPHSGFDMTVGLLTTYCRFDEEPAFVSDHGAHAA